MYVKDQKGQKFTADEGISLHKEKPPNQTISQHLPTTTDCTGQLVEEINVHLKGQREAIRPENETKSNSQCCVSPKSIPLQYKDNHFA